MIIKVFVDVLTHNLMCDYAICICIVFYLALIIAMCEIEQLFYWFNDRASVRIHCCCIYCSYLAMSHDMPNFLQASIEIFGFNNFPIQYICSNGRNVSIYEEIQKKMSEMHLFPPKPLWGPSMRVRVAALMLQWRVSHVHTEVTRSTHHLQHSGW